VGPRGKSAFFLSIERAKRGCTIAEEGCVEPEDVEKCLKAKVIGHLWPFRRWTCAFNEIRLGPGLLKEDE